MYKYDKEGAISTIEIVPSCLRAHHTWGTETIQGMRGPLWDLITNIKKNFIQVLLIYDIERLDSLL